MRDDDIGLIVIEFRQKRATYLSGIKWGYRYTPETYYQYHASYEDAILHLTNMRLGIEPDYLHSVRRVSLFRAKKNGEVYLNTRIKLGDNI